VPDDHCRARATVTRRLCTVAGFYKYAFEEEVLSEATGADIEHLGLERGHRTLTVTRKGGKVVTSRWRRVRPARWTWPPASAPKDRYSWPRTGGGWTGTAPGGSSARSPARL
jgi:hypothetical protein